MVSHKWTVNATTLFPLSKTLNMNRYYCSKFRWNPKTVWDWTATAGNAMTTNWIHAWPQYIVYHLIFSAKALTDRAVWVVCDWWALPLQQITVSLFSNTDALAHLREGWGKAAMFQSRQIHLELSQWKMKKHLCCKKSGSLYSTPNSCHQHPPTIIFSLSGPL